MISSKKEEARLQICGHLKVNATDFVVREIMLDGKPVTLYSRENENIELSYQNFLSTASNVPSLSSSEASVETGTTSYADNFDLLGSEKLAELKRLSMWISDPPLMKEIVSMEIHCDNQLVQHWSKLLASLRSEFPSLLFKSNHAETSSDLVSLQVHPDLRFADLIDVIMKSQDIYDLYSFRSKSVQPSKEVPPCNYVDIGLGLNKDQRTQVFRIINAGDPSLQIRCQSAVEGLEDQSHSMKLLRVTRKPSKKRKLSHLNGGTCYAHFTIFKKNMDNLHCLKSIAKCLSLPPSKVSVAGTKDKKACTFQRCSVALSSIEYNQRLSRVRKLLQTYPLSGIDDSARCIMVIGNLTFRDRPLNIGELWGNSFSITLRNVEMKQNQLAEIEIKKLLECRKEAIVKNGFLNLYGTQRTGSFRENILKFMEDHEGFTESQILAFFSSSMPVGPVIGKHLLLGEYEDAISLIMKGRSVCDEHQEEGVSSLGCEVSTLVYPMSQSVFYRCSYLC